MEQQQPKLTGKEQWTILKRLLKYLNPHKKMLLIALTLLGLTVAGDIAGPYLIKIFIDDHLTPRNFPEKVMLGLALGYIFIQIANAIISYFQLLKFQELALKIIQQLRIDVFTKVQGLGMRYFDRTPAGSIVSRVTNDTEAIKDMFVSVLLAFLQSGFLVVGVYIAMFSLNVKLALFTLVLLPLLFLIVKTYRKYSSVFYQDLRERLSQLNAKLAESLQGMGIIQAFRQEDRLQDEFNDINDKHWKAGMRNIKLDGVLLRPAVDLVYAVALILLLSYFGITSFDNIIEVGVIYAFVSYIDRFFEPINNVMQRMSIFQLAIVAASRVFALLDEPDMAPEQKEEETTKITDARIEFKDVTFSYDGKQDVLKNISFTAEPGQTVALVGHTGSGKSSIINLLMRFYEFEKGDIIIDGKSVKDFPKDEIREKIGLVLQDPFLFYGTIESNIRLHKSDMTAEDVIAGLNSSKQIRSSISCRINTNRR